MRIKRIELNGFKSFLERTVLELPLGVTAIVGPNGCGKSNIVDAIRWVLGEQSPKHLRGEAMEDVIFTGNAENGPLGMAEVTLLLERSERDLERPPAAEDGDGVEEGLPAALADASEIAITRRYFRSGESEYFINRMPCRLRDITELFLGTGVGTKAYAIIEQGRVEQLVNAKPEEVRLFIEEAAGTTRFRSRKLAAERKMERTRDNLVRVQDVLREIERQMASLDRQARRAEEYHRIKDGLKALDLGVMAARQRAWSEEICILADRLAAMRAEEAQLQDASRRSRSATAEGRARRSADEDRLHACEEEIAEHRLRAGEARTLGASLAARRGVPLVVPAARQGAGCGGGVRDNPPARAGARRSGRRARSAGSAPAGSRPRGGRAERSARRCARGGAPDRLAGRFATRAASSPRRLQARRRRAHRAPARHGVLAGERAPGARGPPARGRGRARGTPRAGCRAGHRIRRGSGRLVERVAGRERSGGATRCRAARGRPRGRRAGG